MAQQLTNNINYTKYEENKVTKVTIDSFKNYFLNLLTVSIIHFTKLPIVEMISAAIITSLLSN